MPFPLVPVALAAGSAVAGGLAAKLAKKGKYEQVSPYNAQQKAALDQQLQQGQQNASFQGIEDRARKQFQTKTIPSIAERFASMGQNRASSGLLGSLGGAGADLDSQLAALRSQYGMQQLQQGLRPQFENFYRTGEPGFWGGALGGLSGGLGQAAGLGFGQHFGLFGQQQPQQKPPSGGGGQPYQEQVNPVPVAQNFSTAMGQQYNAPTSSTDLVNMLNVLQRVQSMQPQAQYGQFPISPMQGQQNFNNALSSGYNPLLRGIL